MGKPDRQQPKLSFETNRLTKTRATTASDTEPELKPSTSSKLERMMLAMQHSLQAIDSKIDTLNLRMDNMTTKLDRHGSRITEAEQRISDAEDQVGAVTESCTQMEKLLAVIQAKNEDLEARSRRNNLRITGVPETTNMGKMELYVEAMLKEMLGAEHFSNMLVVERAHRSLAPKPVPGAPPRPIIARLLNYRDRDTALRLAWEKATTIYQGVQVALFPDFMTAIQQARQEFHPTKKKLQTLKIQYAMLYPARLRIQHQGKVRIFSSPKDAMQFVRQVERQEASRSAGEDVDNEDW